MYVHVATYTCVQTQMCGTKLIAFPSHSREQVGVSDILTLRTFILCIHTQRTSTWYMYVLCERKIHVHVLHMYMYIHVQCTAVCTTLYIPNVQFVRKHL